MVSRAGVIIPGFSVASGTGASLAKDIPFAALYWTMLEPLRGTMLQLLSGDLTASGAMTPELGEAPPPRTPAELLGVNIASAGVALAGDMLETYGVLVACHCFRRQECVRLAAIAHVMLAGCTVP